MAALLVFGVFLVAIVLSMPIAVSMILGSAAPIFLMDKGGSMVQLLNNTFSGANSTPILAVPLFILGGVIMAKGGISKKLFNFFAYFVGRLPGGLPCAVILTCLFYGAISGSGPATTAAVGSMCIPFLTELGYDKKMVCRFGGSCRRIGRDYSAFHSLCLVFAGYRRFHRRFIFRRRAAGDFNWLIFNGLCGYLLYPAWGRQSAD